MEPKDVAGIIIGLLVLAAFAGGFIWIIVDTPEHEWQYSSIQQDTSGNLYQVKRCHVCHKSKIRYVRKSRFQRKKSS